MEHLYWILRIKWKFVKCWVETRNLFLFWEPQVDFFFSSIFLSFLGSRDLRAWVLWFLQRFCLCLNQEHGHKQLHAKISHHFYVNHQTFEVYRGSSKSLVQTFYNTFDRVTDSDSESWIQLWELSLLCDLLVNWALSDFF